jgi:archaellum biogenesis protein FlaJ (TadC family)
MPAREMRMEMFVRALLRRDFGRAKGHMEKLIKIAGSDEWGKGYTKAIEGIMNALKDNDIDSLVVQLISANDRERAKELLESYSRLANQDFRDDYERGFYTAWSEFLKAYLSQKTLA